MAMDQETSAVMRRLPAVCLLLCFLLTACSHAAEPIQVSHSGSGAYEAALATDEKGFAVAWYDSRDGNPEIYMRLLDDSGRPSGPERRLTASRNPVIVADGQAIIAAWIQTEPDSSEWVYMGTWDRDGRELRTRTRVGVASKTTWNLNIAVDRSGAWIVYDAAASTRANELFLARVEGSGAHLARLTKDDGAESKYPDLKISDEGRLALTWYDMRDGNDEVYLLVGSQSDLRGEIDDRSRRVTMTAGESIGAYLTWNKDVLGLAWSDKTRGVHDIFIQRFDRLGVPLGSEQRITGGNTWSILPAIRPWRAGFALAWTDYQPTSSQIHEGPGEVAFAVVDY